jgi:hypothetical protein
MVLKHYCSLTYKANIMMVTTQCASPMLLTGTHHFCSRLVMVTNSSVGFLDILFEIYPRYSLIPITSKKGKRGRLV